MINEELYNLLNAINKKYKYIGYDRYTAEGVPFFITDKKLAINENGYFIDIWKYDYYIITTELCPCLCSLIDGESKLYNIDLLIQEYEVLREVLDDGKIRTKVN